MHMRFATEKPRRAAREPLSVRRERACARIERERAQVDASWHSLATVVRERERGTLAIAQALATALKLGGAAAAIWMAGRMHAPPVVRRGVMFVTAARTAGRLFARRHHARGSRWQKA